MAYTVSQKSLSKPVHLLYPILRNTDWCEKTLLLFIFHLSYFFAIFISSQCWVNYVVFQFLCHLWSFAYSIPSLWNVLFFQLRKIFIPLQISSLGKTFFLFLSTVFPSGIKIMCTSFSVSSYTKPTIAMAVLHAAGESVTQVKIWACWKAGVFSSLSPNFQALSQVQAHRLTVRTYWCINGITPDYPHSIHETTSKAFLELRLGRKTSKQIWGLMLPGSIK